MSAKDEEMTYGSVPASSTPAPTLRRKATVSAILAVATATFVGFLALTRVSQRLTLGGYSDDDATQHVLDNIPVQYIAPMGPNEGKVTTMCLTPKVWSTSMRLLLIAGYKPDDIRTIPYDVLDTASIPKGSDEGFTRDDRFVLVRDPLDRLYSGWDDKVNCLHADFCECDLIIPALRVAFTSDKDAMAVLESRFEELDICGTPDFGNYFQFIEEVFAQSSFNERTYKENTSDEFGTHVNWFNHFAPQSWLHCDIPIDDITPLKVENVDEWYPDLIDELGLQSASILDGQTWGTITGGEVQPCYYQCGEDSSKLSCDEMVGGVCPTQPMEGRHYETYYDYKMKAKACTLFAEDFANFGYGC
jgi:hypothetical protein